jgi:hypothetical protein
LQPSEIRPIQSSTAIATAVCIAVGVLQHVWLTVHLVIAVPTIEYNAPHRQICEVAPLADTTNTFFKFDRDGDIEMIDPGTPLTEIEMDHSSNPCEATVNAEIATNDYDAKPTDTNVVFWLPAFDSAVGPASDEAPVGTADDEGSVGPASAEHPFRSAASERAHVSAANGTPATSCESVDPHALNFKLQEDTPMDSDALKAEKKQELRRAKNQRKRLARSKKRRLRAETEQRIAQQHLEKVAKDKIKSAARSVARAQAALRIASQELNEVMGKKEVQKKPKAGEKQTEDGGAKKKRKKYYAPLGNSTKNEIGRGRGG